MTAIWWTPGGSLTVHDFEVRTFPERRQDILELLIELWEEWRPDAVFQPSLHDVHQDHQVIAAEGLRAFKRTTILGYEIPWNNFDFAYQWYSALERPHVERKVAVSIVGGFNQLPACDWRVVVCVSAGKNRRYSRNHVAGLVAEDGHRGRADQSHSSDQQGVLDKALALLVLQQFQQHSAFSYETSVSQSVTRHG